MNPKEKQYFLEEILILDSVFYLPGDKPGIMQVPPYKIVTTEHTPLKLKAVPIRKNYELGIKVLRQMIENKQLIQVNSPYANNWFFISKPKDPTAVRLLCDLRKLNLHVVADSAHPMDVEQLSEMISSFDIKEAYFQYPIDHQSSKLTAFNKLR